MKQQDRMPRAPQSVVVGEEASDSNPAVHYKLRMVGMVHCECDAARYNPWEYCKHVRRWAKGRIERIAMLKRQRAEAKQELFEIDRELASLESVLPSVRP